MVYASTMESVLEASNQTEDTVIASNPRKKPDRHGFADDHAVKTHLRLLVDKLKTLAVSHLEHNASNIKNWMDYNRLKMNDGKTELMMFGSKVQLAKCITNIININGTGVQRNEVKKYLGAWLDQNLTLTEHVTRKCHTAMLKLLKIKQHRKVLTEDAANTLVRGLVLSHLKYCNFIFTGLPACRINFLQ